MQVEFHRVAVTLLVNLHRNHHFLNVFRTFFRSENSPLKFWEISDPGPKKKSPNHANQNSEPRYMLWFSTNPALRAVLSQLKRRNQRAETSSTPSAEKIGFRRL
uniref:Uncharacterized protein n=1 Tax=Romanomermis culicivorax TaxID=13658 RepID=A0A915J3P1_ROMCU